MYVMTRTMGLLMSCRLEARIKRGMTSDISGIMRNPRMPIWIVWLNLKGMRTSAYAARLPKTRQIRVTTEAILKEFNRETAKVRGTEETASLGKKISR